jgi:signal peptidase I
MDTQQDKEILMTNLPSTDTSTEDDLAEDTPATRSSLRARFGSLLVSFTIAFLIVCLLRVFVFQIYVVQQESMENTLLPGNTVTVDKLSPDFAGLERGDVIVFSPPTSFAEQIPGPSVSNTGVLEFLFGDNSVKLVKRIIGLPGDTVELKNGQVYLNGQLLNEPYVNSQSGTQPETDFNSSVALTKWVLGPNQLFVMGDHRDMSSDSRTFGPVDRNLVVGRVWLRLTGGLGVFNRPFWESSLPANYTNPTSTPAK